MGTTQVKGHSFAGVHNAVLRTAPTGEGARRHIILPVTTSFL